MREINMSRNPKKLDHACWRISEYRKEERGSQAAQRWVVP